jgi:hypothetical protein
MRPILIALSSIICLTGCSQSGSGNVDSHTVVPRGNGVLGSLRPKVDPKILAKIEQQEAEARAAESNKATSGNPLPGVSSFFGGQGRVLPKVITDPIAPSAEEVAKQSGPIVTSASSGSSSSNSTSPDPTAAAAEMASAAAAMSGAIPQQPQVATYGASYGAVPAPPPGALGGGLIPPPPAVTLSTQAQAMAYAPGSPNPAAVNPYANPYNNPYMNPYGMQYPPQGMIPSAPATPMRPAGSPFSTGGGSSRNSNNDDDDTPKTKKSTANFVPITPTGMEPRSPYKQRDDLKVLWKGFLATSPDIKAIVKDEKTAEQLNKVDVGLPGDSTKGSFEVSQRQVDTIFKSGTVDKRLLPTVKKLQKDLVQSYMRYLYSYNKFALAQQAVGARKQEVDVASSPSESQRAAADLAQAQTDADSTKDDMKAAQGELVSTVGPAAARTIIGHVSSVTPTLESLTQNDSSSDENSKTAKNGGGLDVVSSVGSLFGFHHKKEDAAKTADSDDDSDSKAPAKADKSGKSGKSDKTAKGDKDSKDKGDKADKSKLAKGDKSDKSEKGKGKETKEAKKEKGKDKDKEVKVADKKKDAGDLSPAPESVASKSSASGDSSSSPKSDISFVLREVNVTPRKSVLTVSIHNSGSNSFSFGPDAVSISDGTHKLSDAAVRADFDQTLVPPNQDVKGTITIFGRPYNDKLAVVLSDGGKSVQMRRQN